MPHLDHASEKGVVGGLATLDGTGKIPNGQLPDALARDIEVAGAIAAHEMAADPHAVYQMASEKGAANGYAALDGNGQIPIAACGTGVALSIQALLAERINYFRERVLLARDTTPLILPFFAEAFETATVVYAENFDGPAHTFTIAGNWGVGAPGAGDPSPPPSGAKYLKTKFGGSYDANQDSNADSGPFNSTGTDLNRVTVGFDVFCQFEDHFDGVLTDVLDGAALTPIEPSFFNGKRVYGYWSNIRAASRRPGFSNSLTRDNEFRPVEFDLPALLLGKTGLKFRLNFRSDSSSQHRGMALDNFTVTKVENGRDAAASPFLTTTLARPTAPQRFVVVADDDPKTGSISYEISRDGGAAFQAVVLSNIGIISGTRKFRGSGLDVFTAAAGTSVIVRATITGDARVYGIAHYTP